MNTLDYKLYLLLEGKDQYIVNAFGNKLAHIWNIDPNSKDTIQAKVNSVIMPLDPTANKSNAVWIARLIASNKLKEEDYYKVPEALTWFDKIKPKLAKKDIMQYADLPELHTAIKPFETGEVSAKSGKQEAKDTRQGFIDKGQAVVFYKGQDATIIIPKSKAASCEFGKGTRWCTAANSSNQFANYNKTGTLYIIYSKATGAPHQMHVQKKLNYGNIPFYVANSSDSSVSVNMLYEQIPDAITAIFKEYEEQALKSEDGRKLLARLGLLIDYFSKYVKKGPLTKVQILTIHEETDDYDTFKRLSKRYPEAFKFKNPKSNRNSGHNADEILSFIYKDSFVTDNHWNDYATVKKKLAKYFIEPVDVIELITSGAELATYGNDTRRIDPSDVYYAVQDLLNHYSKDSDYIPDSRDVAFNHNDANGVHWAVAQIEKRTPIGKKLDRIFADIVSKYNIHNPMIGSDFSISKLIPKDKYDILAHSATFKKIAEILETDDMKEKIKQKLEYVLGDVTRSFNNLYFNGEGVNALIAHAPYYGITLPPIPTTKQELVDLMFAKGIAKSKDPAGVIDFPISKITQLFDLMLDNGKDDDINYDELESHGDRASIFRKQEQKAKAIKTKNGVLIFGNTYSLLVDMSQEGTKKVRLLNTYDVINKAGETLKAAITRNITKQRGPADSIDDVTIESYKQKMSKL